MAFEQTGQGGLTEGSRSGTGLLSRQRAFQLLNRRLPGGSGGGGAGGGIPGGGGASNTAVPTVTSAERAAGVTPGAVSGLEGASTMAIDPMTWGMILSGAGQLLGPLLGGGDEGAEQIRQSFAGTSFDPRLVSRDAADFTRAFADLTGQVAANPPQLTGTIAQQPPVISGGSLPFPVGVTGVDPAIADPSLLQVPGLDTSGLQDALDSLSILTGGEASDLAGEEKRQLSRTRFEGKEGTGRTAIPRELMPPGGGLVPGQPPTAVADLEEPFQSRVQEWLESLGQRTTPDVTDIDGMTSAPQTPQAARRRSAGFEALEQAASAPGTGLRRRRPI